MIPKGLFTQIIMFVVAIGILITFVQPMFGKIALTQNEIGTYTEEQEKVTEVNNRLNSLVARLDSISADDYTRLRVYLPDTIDEIHVIRDLKFIAEQSGVLYKSSSAYGQNPDPMADDNIEFRPRSQAFNLQVEGTYPQIKRLFSLMEQSNYPLEVHGVSITQIDGGFLSADIEVWSYSFREPDFSSSSSK